MDEHYDAIVIGSGFGGSVMAYRLAKAGMRVCLLERGKAYPPGKFPRTPSEMRRNFWDPSEGLHGLFNIWSFQGLDAIVASGLGGGSLIYANVLLEKDEKWFVQGNPDDPNSEDWPITYDQLVPHYQAVKQVLNPQEYPFKSAPYNTTRKTIEFRNAAETLNLELRATPLGVIFHNPGCADIPDQPIVRDQYNLHGHAYQRRTCSLCGECDIGCNSGSKNTLDHTYLSQAEWYGAKIMTRCEADLIAPNDDGGYSVTYIERRPDDEGQRRERSKLQRQRLTADQLVLAAGAIGSTSLLLRNKDRFCGISDRLGTRFSGNGDLLGFAVKRNLDGPDPDRFYAARGPVITSSIRIPDQADTGHVNIDGRARGFYIQDAGYPNFASWMLHLLDLPGAIWVSRRSLRKFLRTHFIKRRDVDAGAEVAELFGYNKRSTSMLPLLGMGRDIPNGVLQIYKEKIDLVTNWKKRPRLHPGNREYFQRVSTQMEAIAAKMQARFTRSMHLRFRRAVTVHPLGGCPMGRTIFQGVVDSHGQVFNFPGLFVADGSVMPGPVGPNPSLTIAALADRFADQVIENYRHKHLLNRATPVGTASLPAIRLRFTEELRGYITRGETDSERGFRVGRERDTPLLAHLTIFINAVDTFVADPQRRGGVGGYIAVGAHGERWLVERGDFNLFEAGDPSGIIMRYWLYARSTNGTAWTLVGVKRMSDSGGLQLRRDISTVFTRILLGHVAPENEQDAKIMAAGILTIRPLDVLKQIPSFRVEGAKLGRRLGACWAFGKLFVSNIWKRYRARPQVHARRA